MWLEQVKKEQAERRILEVKMLCDPTVPDSAWVSISDDIRYHNKYIQYLEDNERYESF
jgi:hypothetical protein